MQAVVATLLCIAQLAATVLGQSQTNVFVNPPPATNPARVAGSFIVGSSLNLVWSTKGRNLDLFIHQILPNGNSSELQYLPNSRGLQSTTEFLWKVDFSGTGGNPNFDLKFSPTFYFGIVESGATKVSTLSQEVNFTSNAVTSSGSTQTPLPSPTSSRANSITATTSSGSSTVATVTDNSSLPTSTISSGLGESNKGLSASTKTGLGVGIGVGVIGLIAGFGVGYWFFKRKKAAPEQTHPEQMYIESPPYVAQSGQWTSGLAPPASKQYERSELQ
ncbi:hypothetical protein BKA65DRAFT_124228 [Rhexocercosporidium sp. MPI-PUGE-AT-0058]|nr:hypothetical protein BKA65DRAFT_124228 [Rhexocercosporidium sp. MPI-PUGE-AT-0058]